VDAISRKYAQEQGSKLIVNITDSQRATVRQIAGKALNGDYTVDQAARRIREGIGLHPRWATAVENYRARLEANPRPKGISASRHTDQIDRSVERYRDRLVRARSLNIARTEVLTAENLGRYASWSNSIGLGFNSPASRKEWAPGPGACEKCSTLAGEIVAWDQPFSNGALMPPAHPSCRCSANLLPPEYQNNALNPRAINWTNPAGDRAGETDYAALSHGYELLDGAASMAVDDAAASEDGGQDDTAPEEPTEDDSAAMGEDGYPDYTGLRAAQAIPAEPTAADTLTYEATAHMSDEELAGKLADYADDPEAIDKILGIMDQRDVVAAQAEEAAARQAAFEAADAKYLAEQEAARQAANTFAEWTPPPAEDPVTRPSARPERKLTPDQKVAEDYQLYVMNQYSKALEELNGNLLNKAGREKAKSNYDLSMNIFSGQAKVARKYASEELIQWWEENGRESLGSFRYRALGRQSDYWYVEAQKKVGWEKTWGGNRDRSTF
jgi:hypothetical protein